MASFKLRALCFSVISTCCTVVHANDVKLGPTYPIAEEPVDDYIIRQLKEKQASGQLGKIMQTGKERALNTLRNPKPVAGIALASEYKAFRIDPTYTQPTDLLDHKGSVIAKAGTKVNPLEVYPLAESLVFFDGNDKEQVNAVDRLLVNNKPIRLILVSGSWSELSKKWKRQVYFDQHGILSGRFSISAVPTVIKQVNNVLLREEFPPKDLKL
jgi:conjugal transfer pilus assembly protein TraW